MLWLKNKLATKLAPKPEALAPSPATTNAPNLSPTLATERDLETELTASTVPSVTGATIIWSRTCGRRNGRRVFQAQIYDDTVQA